MTDKLAPSDIYGRLDRLEAMVLGSRSFDRKLFKQQVALREGKSPRQVDRDVWENKVLPPPDGVTNNRPWWWLSTLERHDRERIRAATRAPSGQGARKRAGASAQNESTT